MPRRLRSPLLESRSSRLKLEPRGKPYWISIAGDGISLGYRAGPSTWSVRRADGAGSSWIRRLGLADDREDADGANILDLWQACDKAKALARGQDSGRPATVSEALDDYATDLAIRGGQPLNATQPRFHLTPPLLSKPVSLLTDRELRHWRNGLAGKMKAASVNRLCKSLKAALNLCAAHDDRIGNSNAWRTGLAAIPEADDTESNLILTDDQRREVITRAYDMSPEFGLYVEVHATGARSGQIALLNVGDLQAGAKPLLSMPSSLKGKNRRTRTRKPIPITQALAGRLKAGIVGRGDDQPLLVTPNGERWSADEHYRPFAKAAKAASLPDGATIYCLRHTAITRALLAGIPVRLVASSFDTSVAMVEKSYSKFIADHGDDQMRRAPTRQATLLSWCGDEENSRQDSPDAVTKRGRVASPRGSRERHSIATNASGLRRQA
jgi:integrase